MKTERTRTRTSAEPAARPAADQGPSRWYKDAVIYELHVRAFHDSNGDGVGDFRGLISRLDYIADLGVTTIWLLPFYPSPLKDDGYDIADYTSIHASYGTLRDFRLFMREARARGLRVITELVLNHTSDQHQWFQRARRSPPGSSLRDFYVWSDTPDRYAGTRVIFKDFESSNWSWDPVAQAYYWHRFYSHQPDLNYDNPEVQRAMFRVVDFWLGLGVDGLRLDAVPYLFEREDTSCENLQETYEFLRDLRRHVEELFEDRMLLAEANQWPEDAAAYFGQGDGCHMAFHFPLMPRMFMATRMEDRFPVVDILTQTPEIPDSAQWAIFLRNHDELTLEMVTDEERDYMYRVYAEDPQARINLGIRRRLAPLLGNNRQLIEMMNGLLFTLPGTPVIYYGDEIGMGDNIYLGDRNGVRTPMQWSADRNGGFSPANPQKLYLPVIIDPEYHMSAINVEAQQSNRDSLLWWMRRIIAMRKRYQAFGRGTLEFLYPENRKVLAFLRRYEDETILVVANLSRFAQPCELDLSEFDGRIPVELFGQTQFPAIGELPYFLTLGPYGFTWFSLERPEAVEVPYRQPGGRLPVLRVVADWGEILGVGKARLEEILPAYLRTRRWFRSKARRIKAAEIADVITVRMTGEDGGGERPEEGAAIAIVQVDYTEGDPETYVLPLAASPLPGDDEPVEWQHPGAVARLRGPDGDHVLFDGFGHPGFAQSMLQAIARRRILPGRSGRLYASPTMSFRRVRGPASARLEGTVMHGEQTNTSLSYGDRLVLKVFRRIEEGTNPDLEIGRYLTEHARFPHIPPVAGSLEYVRERRPMTLGILHGFVPNEGDAWAYTLDALRSYVDQTLVRRQEIEEPPVPRHPVLLELARAEPPALAQEMIGPYLESARLLGARTAEMHVALAANTDDPAFAPEAISSHYQRALFQSMRSLTEQVFQMIRAREAEIPQVVQILDLEQQILERFRSVAMHRLDAVRIRVHGDYHLGQVLWTGRDFVIIDFEGEPARPLGERRIKRSPVRDVAGMIRSFHYAAYSALFDHTSAVTENPALLEPWVLYWYVWVAASFLRSYVDVAGEGRLLSHDPSQLHLLLDAFLLEKAVYELRYEINNRPDWVRIPIEGILQQVESGG